MGCLRLCNKDGQPIDLRKGHQHWYTARKQKIELELELAGLHMILKEEGCGKATLRIPDCVFKPMASGVIEIRKR